MWEWIYSSQPFVLPNWMWLLWAILFALHIGVRIVTAIRVTPLKDRIKELEAERDYFKEQRVVFHDNAMKLADKVYRTDLEQSGFRFVHFVVAPEEKEDG